MERPQIIAIASEALKAAKKVRARNLPQNIGIASEALKAADKVRVGQQGRRRFEVYQVVDQVVDGPSKALQAAAKVRAGRQGRRRSL